MTPGCPCCQLSCHALLCPASLLQRRELWRRQREEQLRCQPDPDLPPGHSLVPEGQRLETLSSLQQSKREESRGCS